ncbi:MAG: NADH-quinone oxidoreductase subunit M [Desulfobulbaceae bacterium]|jgi:NADH-quinone oxidoreductase subunit M|nr:NADH-quinone oxidoreductase subunit M [Desulfobulbaceae bacterium]HKJ14348.1 NADH-quinone oxidoreductase subunit M [Desulfobulbales bacterium]MDH3543175.1 NADH-quinone oxidoreductase subunit M [Desulfobulbaceae bacterium]MDH3783295.1 NADH-quinone oxidoreductase subunit M [Desulfobulbaceae bacterium]MDH3922136.1 NADH-quinone oxidoreductase subunit M [Desulfobulbaceae bacterium]
MQDFLIMNTLGYPILSLLVFLPLAGVIPLLILKNDAAAKYWTLFITIVIAVISLQLYFKFDKTTALYQFGVDHAWIPMWDIRYTLGIDGISLLLILLTTMIMPLCVLCSWNYITTRVRPFLACLLIMETSMLGVFMALDFVLFYILWEAMLIPMYLLIAIWGGPRKIYASIKFFLYTLAGSVLLLVAIIALYMKNGTFSIPMMMGQDYSSVFQIYVFLAFFLAFAIKVPMFPFHTWLPAAHVEAPTAGSVVLASVLLKMGTYGFLRFCLPITPEASIFFMPYILWLSIAGIIYGGFTALAQQDMKKLIAYSSVGHMGFVTLGIFVFNAHGIEGALLQMINHGVTTGALFIIVGMIYERTHSRELALAAGVGKFMPVYVTFLGFFSLSSLAFPGTNSFIGEFLVLAGAFAKSKIVAACAIPGAVLAAAYMLRMLQKVVWGGTNNPDQSYLADLNVREIITLAPLLLFVLWIGLNPAPFMDVMHASVNHLIQQVGIADAGPQGILEVAKLAIPH